MSHTLSAVGRLAGFVSGIARLYIKWRTSSQPRPELETSRTARSGYGVRWSLSLSTGTGETAEHYRRVGAISVGHHSTTEGYELTPTDPLG